MKHGREPCRRDAASSLAKHLEDHALPFVAPGGTLRWHQKGSALDAGVRAEVTREQIDLGVAHCQRNQLLSKREDMTLNMNSTSSAVCLDYPAPCNSMIVGHIAHLESVIFAPMVTANEGPPPGQQQAQHKTSRHPWLFFRCLLNVRAHGCDICKVEA